MMPMKEDKKDEVKNGKKCPFCFKIFRSAAALSIHMRSHTGEKPYKCDLCPSEFSEFSGLQKHIAQKHSDARPFPCQLCPYMGKTKGMLHKHMTRHSMDKPHACSKCSYRSKYKANLQTHIINVHTDTGKNRPFPCDQCKFSGKTKANLYNHIKCHSSNKPFKCPQCKYKARWKASVKKHVGAVHSSDKKFHCPSPDCSFKTKYERHCKEHFLRKHDKGGSPKKIYKCQKCPQTFFAEYQRRRHHIHIHSRDRQHACVFCEKAFFTSAALNLHMRGHTGEKPFKCSHPGCTHSASCGQNLKLHMKSMHGGQSNKRFKCTFQDCQYSSHHNNHFKDHLLTHTQKFPFKCPHPNCPWQGGRSRATLAGHIQSYHVLVKRFKCNFPPCNYEAAIVSILKKHERKHTGEKPYKCPREGCTYAASLQASVKQHQKTHEVERPFPCPVQGCSHRFKTKAGLRQHDNQMHRVQKMEEGDGRRVIQKMNKDKTGEVKWVNKVATNQRKTGTETSAGGVADTGLKCKLWGSAGKCSFYSKNYSDLASHLNQVHQLPRVQLEPL